MPQSELNCKLTKNGLNRCEICARLTTGPKNDSQNSVASVRCVWEGEAEMRHSMAEWLQGLTMDAVGGLGRKAIYFGYWRRPAQRRRRRRRRWRGKRAALCQGCQRFSRATLIDVSFPLQSASAFLCSTSDVCFVWLLLEWQRANVSLGASKPGNPFLATSN